MDQEELEFFDVLLRGSPSLIDDPLVVNCDVLRDEWIQSIIDEEEAQRLPDPTEGERFAKEVPRREEPIDELLRADDEGLFVSCISNVVAPRKTRRWWSELKVPLRLCEHRLRRLRARGGHGPRCRNLERRAMQYVRAVLRSVGDDPADALRLLDEWSMVRLRQLWIAELSARRATGRFRCFVSLR